MKPKLGHAWAAYSMLVVLSGFVSLGFQVIMWYYVAKFVGIPTWVWGGFAIAAALVQIFMNSAKQELKDFTEAVRKWQEAPDAG